MQQLPGNLLSMLCSHSGLLCIAGCQNWGIMKLLCLQSTPDTRSRCPWLCSFAGLPVLDCSGLPAKHETGMAWCRHSDACYLQAASQPDMGAFAEAGYASILESDGDASPAIVASGEASGEANRYQCSDKAPVGNPPPVLQSHALQRQFVPCRRRLLCETDPVNSVRLAAFLKQHVEQSAHVHGSAFQEAWGRLDPRLAAQLQNDMNR